MGASLAQGARVEQCNSASSDIENGHRLVAARPNVGRSLATLPPGARTSNQNDAIPTASAPRQFTRMSSTKRHSAGSASHASAAARYGRVAGFRSPMVVTSTIASNQPAGSHVAHQLGPSHLLASL